MTTYLLFIFIGLLAGVCSGVFGVGGGLIMVPMMVFFVGLTQHQAQGTSLAVMLPPVGFLAVYHYYQNGNINIEAALWIGLGFVIGALGGGFIVQPISSEVLKKIFGVFLALVSIKMISGK